MSGISLILTFVPSSDATIFVSKRCIFLPLIPIIASSAPIVSISTLSVSTSAWRWCSKMWWSTIINGSHSAAFTIICFTLSEIFLWVGNPAPPAPTIPASYTIFWSSSNVILLLPPQRVIMWVYLLNLISIVSRQVYRQSLRQLVNLHHRLQLSHCYP